ncbi:MAG: NUDIX hydrolase [Myxococcales bacterium]|nr:NUDIX hydrolase [Polyangiaceae bacterium]MDW8248293.1 NUDIX hydrolase [Myxococcales bacterium]
MSSLLQDLRRYVPADEHETRSLARIITHVEGGGDLFDRRRWDGHLTGSAFILDTSGERLLLLFHRKLDRWLQPGGHGEPGETDPLVVARREALEESGIEGLILHPRVPGIFDVDVHLIPARGEELAHEHLDLRYLFLAPPRATLAPAEGESRRLAWVPLAEVAAISDASVARAARKLLIW